MLMPGGSYVCYFTTSNPTTQAPQDADSTPAATAYFDGPGTGSMALTVTHVATGLYKATGTVPGTRADGDQLNVIVSATVASSPGSARVDRDYVDDKSGYQLAADGWDLITIEPAANGGQTIHARQAISLMGSIIVGNFTGGAGNTPAFAAMGNPTVARVSQTLATGTRTNTLTLVT